MKSRQSGATLIVGLVMLVVLTLLAMSAIRTSNINFRIAGNAQAQAEIRSAAQQALEKVISTNVTKIATDTTVPIDINGDGASDYAVSVTKPVCTYSKQLLSNDPALKLPDESFCLGSLSSPETLIVIIDKTIPVLTWCSLQHWETTATSTDTRTGARSTMTQGVKLKVPAGTTC
jgi:Tfp pilus assembly protein PilE